MKLWNFHGQQNTLTEALQLKLPEHIAAAVPEGRSQSQLRPTCSIPSSQVMPMPDHIACSIPGSQVMPMPEHIAASAPEHIACSIPGSQVMPMPDHIAASAPEHIACSIPSSQVMPMPDHIAAAVPEHIAASAPKHTGKATVISVVGAGGKTTLIFALARELASAGKKVAVTTTTHMLHPELAGDAYAGKAIVYYPGYISDEKNRSEDRSQIDRLLKEEGILMISSRSANDSRKVTSPPVEILEYAYTAADVVLIEADGSRGLPLKWPKEHEPVVPEHTYMSIYVAGMSSFGQTVSDCMYNSDALPSHLTRDKVNEALIAFLASSPDAGLKGTYGDYRVFLNQTDTDELQQNAADIQRLLAVRGVQSAWGTFKSQS